MRDAALEAAKAVANNLADRKGLGNEWEVLDNETQDEIVATWARLIERAFAVEADAPDRTVVELATAAIERTKARQQQIAEPDAPHGKPSALREYAIAITHLEDAAMRYTRGRAIELDVFKPADLDRREAIEERHDWTGKALAAIDEEQKVWPVRPEGERGR